MLVVLKRWSNRKKVQKSSRVRFPWCLVPVYSLVIYNHCMTVTLFFKFLIAKVLIQIFLHHEASKVCFWKSFFPHVLLCKTPDQIFKHTIGILCSSATLFKTFSPNCKHTLTYTLRTTKVRAGNFVNSDLSFMIIHLFATYMRIKLFW